MSQRLALLVSAVILVVASVYVNFGLDTAGADIPGAPLSSFPGSFPGWSSEDREFPTKILENLGVDEYLMRRYIRGTQSVWMYIGYYSRQREGAVPHSPRHCYPGSGFSPIRSGVISIPVEYSGKRSIEVNRYLFAKGPEREVVIYWYQSRGRVIADEYMERACLVWDAILRNRSDGALVRFSTSATPGTEVEAENLLASFISMVYPQIPKVVPD